MPQLSLGQMGRALIGRPDPAPDVELPRDAPNRPIGQDWLSDAADALMGGLGLNNPLDPRASKATQIGGLIAAAIPLGMAGKFGRAAQDLKEGFTLPQARVPLSETRMREFLASHGGTLAAKTAAEMAPTAPVVFDDKTVELLRKYGIALPLSAGMAATAARK